MAEGMSVKKGKSKRNKDQQREEKERQLAWEKEQESKQFVQKGAMNGSLSQFRPA